MKKLNLSELFGTIGFRRIAALMMVIVMLAASTGCSLFGVDEEASSNASSSQEQTSSDNASSDLTDSTPSDTTSNEDTTSDNQGNYYDDTANNGGTNNGGTENGDADNEGTTSVDPLSGNINVDYEYKAGTSRTDATEIEPAVDPAPFYKGLVGYAEEERNKLRDEILNTKNTLEYYTPKNKDRIFYVSTKGSDANDGTSPEKAIQSLAAVDSLLLQAGDTVLFERGCIWRMGERFECQEGVLYGSYGEGRKPMILGSPKNFAQEIWKPSKKKNVWQINYMYAYPCGAFLDEGREIGYQKLTMRELEKNTDYFFDEETATLYFYCDKGNPSNVYYSMEFSQENMLMHISTGVDDVTVDNICIRYTGSGGVGTLYNNANIDVTNCEIAYTGGVWMGNVRGGNGLGSWCGGLDYNWDHNWVYQTFDSGMSPQGNISNHNYDNITMCNNLFEYNNCDIESWESGYGRADIDRPMTTYSNNHYDNNICRFTSLGWGTRADDGGIRGIDGVHYGHFAADQIKSMTFNNNIIDCPGRMIYKMTIGNKACYDNWERKGNVYYIRQSIRTMTNLTFQFHWKDEETRVAGHYASTKAETLAAFAEFEPDATVYWYK